MTPNELPRWIDRCAAARGKIWLTGGEFLNWRGEGHFRASMPVSGDLALDSMNGGSPSCAPSSLMLLSVGKREDRRRAS